MSNYTKIPRIEPKMSNDTLWYSYDPNELDMQAKRLRTLINAYTVYDLKIIEEDAFFSIIDLLLSKDDDNAFIAEKSVEFYRKSKKFQLYRKLNKRLPFARSAKEEGMGLYDNVCVNCAMQIKEIYPSYCVNPKCSCHPTFQSLKGNLGIADYLWAFLEVAPSHLRAPIARSIQRRSELGRKGSSRLYKDYNKRK